MASGLRYSRSGQPPLTAGDSDSTLNTEHYLCALHSAAGLSESQIPHDEMKEISEIVVCFWGYCGEDQGLFYHFILVFDFCRHRSGQKIFYFSLI